MYKDLLWRGAKGKVILDPLTIPSRHLAVILSFSTNWMHQEECVHKAPWARTLMKTSDLIGSPPVPLTFLVAAFYCGKSSTKNLVILSFFFVFIQFWDYKCSVCQSRST